MGNVRKSQVMDQLQQATQPANGVESPNGKIEWNDQDLADAFVEKGKSHGVTISPETAMEVANQIRSKVKKNDVLELHSIINEITADLFPNNPEASATKASLDLLTVIGTRVEKYKTILAQEANGPIGAEEEAELRGGILNDVILPMQEGIKDTAADATRKLMRELLPLRQRKIELKQYLDDTSKIDALEADAKANPSDKKKEKAFRAEMKIRGQKAVETMNIIAKESVIESKLILLDRASGYLQKKLEVMDQYHGVDGMSRYFEKVFEPAVKDIKDIIMQVRKGIVLPEVTAKARHERDWVMRHHHTKSYQSGSIGPNVDDISFEEFSESPVYKELRNRGVSDQKISESINVLENKPMTWRKGQAIYMLLDPPAQKTINKDIPTLMENPPVNEQGKLDWSSDIVTNQPFNIEKGKFDEQKDKMEKGTNPRAMTKERKISEASNDKAHWSVLFNLTRNQRVDASGKTRAEKYLESLPENVRNNEEVLDTAAKMEEEDHLHDKEIIYSALLNPNTPDWVLMKAALTGYAETTRRIAKAVLERKRGWQPKLTDAGDLVKDPETNDFVWERIPGFEAAASLSLKQILGQVTPPPSPTSPSQDQAMATKNALQEQINAIDQQMQTGQGQAQQLQVQKTNLQKQMDSVKMPAPAQPGAAPAVPGAIPAGQPMAADTISFRKFADMYGLTEVKPEDSVEEEYLEPTEPEEGDFVYDDASSGLSIAGEKFLGKFIEWDDVEQAIREYAKKHQFFPNVWKISDHGNAILLTDFSYDDTTKPVENTKPFYQRMRDAM